MTTSPPLRFGILGAARIAPKALLVPARHSDRAQVVAVAARDSARAEAFAGEHGIPRALDSYEALVADPDVDVVYNPLPAALHGRWTRAALEAGKHVLCEKPFTANAAEATAVAEAATGTGLVVMEAFHYRYHPLMSLLLDLVASGRLGGLRHVEAFFRAHIGRAGDIRWEAPLGGGSLMDIGCYPLHLVRTVVGEEPEVVAASAETRSEGVDRTLVATLRFPGGASGRVSSAMLSRRPRASGGLLVGTHGWARFTGFVAPQHGATLTVRDRRGVRRLRVPRLPTTYDAQLAAFCDAVLDGTPVPTGLDDAVAQMTAIDACYTAAGLAPRQPLLDD